jgi:hypothetical protein
LRDVPGNVLEPAIDSDLGAITPEPDQAVGLLCWEGTTKVYEGFFVFTPAQPLPVINAAADAALLARELLPLPDPDIATSPPVGRPQLAGVATWYRIGDAWQTFSATATLEGVSATVTATPTTVVWEPGDGAAAFTCTGPGDVYDPNDPRAVSDCAHTYTVATADGASVALTATITYEVAWTATDGSADTLDPVTRTATVALEVDEVQAVIR